MNDVQFMSSGQRLRHLDSKVNSFCGRHRTIIQTGSQSTSLQKLHHYEGLCLKFLDVVDSTDIRMIQIGSRPRFAEEPFESFRVGEQRLRQELECDEPL